MVITFNLIITSYIYKHYTAIISKMQPNTQHALAVSGATMYKIKSFILARRQFASIASALL